MIFLAVWLVLLELNLYFRDELHEFEMIRKWALWILALFPAAASVLIVFGSDDWPALKALSLVIPIAICGPLIHLIAQHLGQKSDLPGVEGMKYSFWLYLWAGLVSVGPGMLVGLLLKKLARA